MDYKMQNATAQADPLCKESIISNTEEKLRSLVFQAYKLELQVFNLKTKLCGNPNPPVNPNKEITALGSLNSEWQLAVKLDNKLVEIGILINDITFQMYVKSTSPDSL